MNELIKKLVEAYGPSGFEDQMRDLIREEVADLADDISIDAMGNLIALKKGDGSGLKVMIAAHMDEIGLDGDAYHGRWISAVLPTLVVFHPAT